MEAIENLKENRNYRVSERVDVINHLENAVARVRELQQQDFRLAQSIAELEEAIKILEDHARENKKSREGEAAATADNDAA